jgi:hypothetical protein
MSVGGGSPPVGFHLRFRRHFSIANRQILLGVQMLKSFILFVLLMTSVPALAAPPASSDGKAKDPKRKICEPVEETGSRLSSKRICMTAEQWAAQNRNTRTGAKRSDNSSGSPGGN